MQITSCSLLETSAVSSAMIVKNVAFWMFADVCRIMPRVIAFRSSFWISGDVYFSGSFPKPLNDIWIFLSPQFQQLMKIGALLRLCLSVPYQSPLLNGKACRAKYRMLDRIDQGEIFLCSFLMQVSKSPICIYYWPSARSRWLDIGQVLFLRFYGPRRSRGP